MKKRLLCAPVIAISVLTCGCSHWGKSVTRSSRPSPPMQRTDVASASHTPSNNTPADQSNPTAPPVEASKADIAAALAHQTEQYARNMQGSVDKYAANHNQPAGQEAMAGWVDPGDFRIGPKQSGVASELAQSKAPTTSPTLARATIKSPDVQQPATSANQPVEANEPKKATDTANTPVAITSETPAEPTNTIVPVHPSADSLTTKLAARAKDFPRDLSAQLDYQLLLFLQDQSVPELTSISGLPTEDRELLSAVLDGISNFRNTLRSNNNMLLSQKIQPLTVLADRLRAQADLAIPTLVLCSRVDSFGRYEPFDPPHFTAGTDQPAIIYCELANFSSQQKGEKKEWETDVTQQVALFNMDTSEQVWSNKVQEIIDNSRNRRHDFFVANKMTFPKTLTIGRYLLKVTMVDKQSSRVAEASLPVEIVAAQ